MAHALHADNLDWLSDLDECPGFCGRTLNESISGSDDMSFALISRLSVCQACSWGARSSKKSICEKCTTPIRPYDYCFLIFYVLIPFFINGLFVKVFASSQINCTSINRKNFLNAVQLFCIAIETFLALFFSILAFEPRGILQTFGCLKRGSLQEWYPMFYNPVVNYTKTLRCSHELVYPLYSLPFLSMAFCLFNLMLIRSSLYIVVRVKFGVCLPSGSFYAALWVLPITACIHAFFSGAIYYVFPHICVIASLAINAVHLAMERRRTVSEMLRLILSLKNIEHFVLLLIYMALFGFGIVSIVLAGSTAFPPNFKMLFIILPLILPIPTCFYVLTIRLTTPIQAVRYRH